jgi:transcriptional regulator GlxA family with amidase domain
LVVRPSSSIAVDGDLERGRLAAEVEPIVGIVAIRGVIEISHGPGRSDDRHPTEDGMRRVLNHMNAHYAETLRLQALVELAVLSIAQLERHFRRVF